MPYISVYVSDKALKEMRTARDQAPGKGITLFNLPGFSGTDEEMIQLYMYLGLTEIENRIRRVKS